MIVELLKAVHRTGVIKKKQHGPHRYTDPKGRTWEWDVVQKKYIYIPKTGAVPSSDKDKRNQAIIDDYQGGMSLKDLAAKYKLSNARVYGITRGKSSTTTKLKTGQIVGNERTAAYNTSPQDAKNIADTVGVLPVGDKAIEYMKANLQSIFKTSGKEAQYIKGVKISDPLGGLGAWMVDDALVDSGIVALEECIKDIKDSDSDYWKSLKGMDRDHIQKAMEGHLDSLQKLVKDRTALDEIHDVLGDALDDNAPSLDMSKLGWFPIAWTAPEYLMAAAVSPGDVETSVIEGVDILGRAKEFIKALGMTEESWKKRNWSQQDVYGVLMACMFPDELGPLMERWLTPITYKRKTYKGFEDVSSGGQGNNYPIEGGHSWRHGKRTVEDVIKPQYQVNREQGRDYVYPLPDKEMWTKEDFDKASKKVQELFPALKDFLTKHFVIDKDTLESAIEHKTNQYDRFRREEDTVDLDPSNSSTMGGPEVKVFRAYSEATRISSLRLSSRRSKPRLPILLLLNTCWRASKMLLVL